MDKKLSNLGLCKRAGGLITGEELVIEGIRSGKVFLVFLAKDAGENAKKQIKDKSKFYNVEVNESFTTDELSNAIGQANRKVIGITVKNFLKILK